MRWLCLALLFVAGCSAGQSSNGTISTIYTWRDHHMVVVIVDGRNVAIDVPKERWEMLKIGESVTVTTNSTGGQKLE